MRGLQAAQELQHPLGTVALTCLLFFFAIFYPSHECGENGLANEAFN
jgi:hypothetical protein